MIRFEPTPGTRFSLSGITDFSSFPADGQTARVRVLEPAGDGWFRIRIGGKTLVARGMPGITPGTEFSARISYSGSTVYIQPLPVSAEPDVFARLGVPQTPVSSFLLAFFQTAQYRLESGLFRSVLSLASRFPGREKRAAEAAAMLILQGIDPDDRLVALLMDIIEGNAGGTDAGERDILAFINQKKGHDRHWLTFPFKRTIHGRTLTGSIRFLVDTALENMIQTRLTVNDGTRRWEFTLEDHSCTYVNDPQNDTVIMEKIALYLQQALAGTGITSVTYSPHDSDESGYSGIDVEI